MWPSSVEQYLDVIHRQVERVQAAVEPGGVGLERVGQRLGSLGAHRVADEVQARERRVVRRAVRGGCERRRQRLGAFRLDLVVCPFRTHTPRWLVSSRFNSTVICFDATPAQSRSIGDRAKSYTHVAKVWGVTRRFTGHSRSGLHQNTQPCACYDEDGECWVGHRCVGGGVYSLGK